MRPSDTEPMQDQLEALSDAENRRLLDDPEIPEDVKSEIRDRLEVFRERDLEAALPEGTSVAAEAR